MEDASPETATAEAAVAAVLTRAALVTGGAQGIGRAIVKHLSDAGWQVAALDIDEDALDEVGAWPGVIPLACNLADEAQVTRAVQAAGLDRLDLVVNNGGLAKAQGAALEEMSLESFNGWIGSHLVGTFLVTRACLPALRAAHGAVVNMASTRAFQSEPDSYGYAAAKGGVVALTHAMAIGLGPQVRVNAVAPGWIDTSGWQKGHPAPAQWSAEDHAQHPVGRIGEPADIVGAVMYLCDARFVTGQVIVVDGGMSRKMIYL
ncbi:SDR family oxidoreductase [Frigidibacter sp. MR17.14]|uniref:SDR family oxidoreductase n=1 Tax=Frigidibacter sp. MR17.14 TaxID=3126509 RepID=UPI003012F815